MAPAHAPIFVDAVAVFGREQPGHGVKKRSEKWYIEQNWVLFSLKSALLIQSVPRTNLAATLRTNRLVLKLFKFNPWIKFNVFLALVCGVGKGSWIKGRSVVASRPSVKLRALLKEC